MPTATPHADASTRQDLCEVRASRRDLPAGSVKAALELAGAKGDGEDAALTKQAFIHMLVRDELEHILQLPPPHPHELGRGNQMDQRSRLAA
jgi:hypothetical protein